MTPKRKQWWDSLPQREKLLREQILDVKREISMAKYSLQLGCFTPKAIKLIAARIKKQKVTLTALKHELNRGIKDVDVEYCPWCGGEIKGGEIMSKNLIPEIAKMLGVELGEEFEWHSKHDCVTYRLKFKENKVLYCTRRIYKDLEGKEKIERRWIDGKVVSEFLKEVLGGHDKIIKLPWKPKEGESFYTFTAAYGEWSVSLDVWAEEPCNYALLDKGWIYRAEKEAIAALPTVLKELSERRNRREV